MKMNIIDFSPREVIFSNIRISDEINTELSHEEVMDTFIEYAHKNHIYDEKSGKTILEKNFAVKINTEKFDESSSFILEFYRYYHRFYAIYFIIALILSIFLAVAYEFPPGISRKIGINLILFMIPLALLLLFFETINGIRGIKEVDYSKEADRVFLEVLDAIRRKEEHKLIDAKNSENLFKFQMSATNQNGLKSHSRQKHFSVSRIISRDNTACIILIMNTFGSLMYIASGFDQIILYIILIGFFAVAWRIRFFKILHNRGIEITGNIKNMSIVHKQRIEYEYTFQNENYIRGNVLVKGELERKHYHDGDEVILIVDPENPKRAVIKNLYF